MIAPFHLTLSLTNKTGPYCLFDHGKRGGGGKSMAHFSSAVYHALTFYIRKNQGKDNYNDLNKHLEFYPSPAGDHIT